MPDTDSRLFAIVPAAGLSRRMGTPKLLLPLGKSTVIERMLLSLNRPSITTICVVLRNKDSALKELVERSGSIWAAPDQDPPDMRHSVQFGLEELHRRYNPTDRDGWVLCPADHPILDGELVDEMISIWKQRQPTILVPRCGAKRGHPTIFRWSLEREVSSIPADRGIDWLLEVHSGEIAEFVTDRESVLVDIDTAADYERLKREIEG